VGGGAQRPGQLPGGGSFVGGRGAGPRTPTSAGAAAGAGWGPEHRRGGLLAGGTLAGPGGAGCAAGRRRVAGLLVGGGFGGGVGRDGGGHFPGRPPHRAWGAGCGAAAGGGGGGGKLGGVGGRVDAEGLAPAAAEVQHAGGVVVGDPVRLPPDAGQLGQPAGA
jgi:hypothetical protein